MSDHRGLAPPSSSTNPGFLTVKPLKTKHTAAEAARLRLQQKRAMHRFRRRRKRLIAKVTGALVRHGGSVNRDGSITTSIERLSARMHPQIETTASRIVLVPRVLQAPTRRRRVDARPRHRRDSHGRSRRTSTSRDDGSDGAPAAFDASSPWPRGSVR